MSQPVYKSFPDATFGRGTGTDWVSRFPLPQVQDLRSRKAAQLDEVRGIAVVETEGKGRNHPITYFTLPREVSAISPVTRQEI